MGPLGYLAAHERVGAEGEQSREAVAESHQVSAFVDNNPRGFGLMQRQRDFRTYEDLEARYERRPSAFVEPIGDWGEGAVHLVEIPTTTEINDNIVTFWRPRAATRAKGEYAYTYRIHWGRQLPKPLPIAKVVSTRIGAG